MEIQLMPMKTKTTLSPMKITSVGVALDSPRRQLGMGMGLRLPACPRPISASPRMHAGMSLSDLCDENDSTFHIPQEVPAVLFSGRAPYLVVDVNNLWLKTCGCERREVIGKTMSIIQGPATERHLVHDMMTALSRRQPHYSTGELQHVRRQQLSRASCDAFSEQPRGLQ